MISVAWPGPPLVTAWMIRSLTTVRESSITLVAVSNLVHGEGQPSRSRVGRDRREAADGAEGSGEIPVPEFRWRPHARGRPDRLSPAGVGDPLCVEPPHHQCRPETLHEVRDIDRLDDVVERPVP